MAKENDYSMLFTYIEALRLKEGERIVAEKLKSTQRVEAFGSIVEKTKAKFKNTYNKLISTAGNYENKNQTAKSELERFNKEHKDVNQKEADEELLALNKSDSTGLASLMFDMKVILDHEYDYVYDEQGLKVASTYLHQDENYLNNLREQLAHTYKIIADKSLSNTQKGILAGVAIASIAACIIVPSVAPGAVAKTAALSTILISGVALGGTYVALKAYNQEEVKKQFRKFDADELAIQLSVQIIAISYLKKKLSEEEFKDKLNLILEELAKLKADLDYYLFVEKEEVKKNKSKLHVFHGFDICLEDILGI